VLLVGDETESLVSQPTCPPLHLARLQEFIQRRKEEAVDSVYDAGGLEDAKNGEHRTWENGHARRVVDILLSAEDRQFHRVLYAIVQSTNRRPDVRISYHTWNRQQPYQELSNVSESTASVVIQDGLR